jgi:hypothetical protein
MLFLFFLLLGWVFLDSAFVLNWLVDGALINYRLVVALFNYWLVYALIYYWLEWLVGAFVYNWLEGAFIYYWLVIIKRWFLIRLRLLLHHRHRQRRIQKGQYFKFIRLFRKLGRTTGRE